MANILICYWAPKIKDNEEILFCYYDSLIRTLMENGNNILALNLIFFKQYDSSEVSNKDENDNIISKVETFNPDIIISFNHQILSDFKTLFDCPIIIWEADTLDLFSNLKDLKSDIDRYHLFTMVKSGIPQYKKFGFPSEKISYIPPATYLQPEKIKQDKNISIIASRFGMTPNPLKLLKKGNHARELYEIFLESIENPIYDYYKYIQDGSSSKELLNLSRSDLWYLFDNRNLILSSLLDLDLTVYGVYWEDMAEFNPQLTYAYNPENIYSVEDNEYVYNSSKICLNINHLQTEGKSFSWRVTDIMATNGCLVSSYSSELKELTKDYVDIPMYKNHIDAREICKKILNDDELRNEIVEGSQEYIKENGRIEDRLKDIGEIVGLNLLNGKNRKVKLDFVRRMPTPVKTTAPEKPKQTIETKKSEELIIPDKTIDKSTPFFRKLSLKKLKSKLVESSNSYVYYKNNYNKTQNQINKLIAKNNYYESAINSQNIELNRLKNDLKEKEKLLIIKTMNTINNVNE